MNNRIYKYYKRNNKWLGVIDYKSLIVILIYFLMLILVLKIIPIPLKYKIYTFIIFFIPVLSFLFVNNNGESSIETVIVIIKYLFFRKIYCKKENIKRSGINKNIKSIKIHRNKKLL